MAINLTKTAEKNNEDNKLILCGLLMTAIDGEVDQSELDVVFQNPYWANLFYEGCTDEFLINLKEGGLVDMCRNEVRTKLLKDSDKQAFINGMMHVIMADGVVDENEVALLSDLTQQCGISQEELSERIAVFSSKGDSKLILCALLMTAIDGDIDESEIQVVLKDAYWANFVYEGCSEEFSTLLENGGLIELCKEECKKHVRTKVEKQSFVHGLLKVIFADGIVDENETALLVDLTSVVGISSDELTEMIQSYGYNSSQNETNTENAQSSPDNKLILAGLLMTAIDGDIDDSEIEVVLNDSYWSKLVYDGCVEEFSQRIEDSTIVEFCRSEVVAHVKTTEEKEDFVNGLVKIVLADGVVDDNEVSLLLDLTKGIGIGQEDLSEMLNGTASPEVGGQKKWYDSNLIVVILLLVFWPAAIFAVYKRLTKK